MNKHFEDTIYYLRRAGEHAKLGVEESVDPVRTRGRELLGRDAEPEREPSRVDTLLEEVKEAERRTIGAARERLEGYRSKA